MTRLLSLGRDEGWKRNLVREALAPDRDAHVLDLATGTAAFPVLLRREGHAGPIVGLDQSGEILQLGRRKCASLRGIRFARGDLEALPFREGAFDVVTIGYGLRYPGDLRAFLRSVFHILRPGGWFLSLDFGLPRNRAYRALALEYLLWAGALWGTLLHGRPGTYAHIVESLHAYPGQEALARMMREAGFKEVSVDEHLGGITVTARGRKG